MADAPQKPQPPAPAAPKPAAAPAKPPAAQADHAPKAAAPTGPVEPAPPADAVVPAFITSLQNGVPGAVAQLSLYLGDWTVIVPVSHLLQAVEHLHRAPECVFDYLSDLTATDWPPRPEGRFDVIYMLYSTRHRHRVRVKVKVAED